MTRVNGITAAFRVAPTGPPACAKPELRFGEGRPAASKALTVAKATLRGLLLADRVPPGAMTRLSLVRNAG